MSDDQDRAWYRETPEEVLAELGTNAEVGLSGSAADKRLAESGPNAIASEPPPTIWAIAANQLRDPMNLMLIGVTVAGLFIGQVPVSILVGLLVVLNVTLATRQEMKARASVDALSKLQIPQARVIRDGKLQLIDAVDLVPGDIINLEAGDLVPADGRLLRSATLETQEAALTGESAPVAKAAETIEADDVALGDRLNMVFQNTSITRGTATAVITATGMATQMGRIASMLTAVKPSRSPLQRELGSLTKVLGVIAWSAVAVIVVIGLARGQEVESILLVGISMAISAIPSGMPTFVQGMLSRGAGLLAQNKAVVKNLHDVETLGATSAINSDKTGTLTLNQMMVRSLYFRGQWFTVDGEGYSKTGMIRHAAGQPVPDFTRLAFALCLCSDATVSDSGEVVGDPTEAALVVLAAKMGVDAEESRRLLPRVCEVPFDSAYKFMATFHRVELDGVEQFVELVKGGPDVILARCGEALSPDGEVVPIERMRDEIVAANERLSSQGLRVLAFATRNLTGREDEVTADPMAFTEELTFAGLVGIVDPLRPEAIAAVETALGAGIDVRMITGDHAVTAGAIGAELGLGEGAISGSELQAMSDEELRAALPDLHVFGRVTPEDKLRLTRLLQESGEIVAMTGDAVNDAAALKQADIGVAMGSGSEVTKQAAKMILTDDNFGTLVTAIELGRGIYDKIVAYVCYQMAGLLSLVMLFLTASIFDINDGTPLTPLMVLFLSFFISIFPVAVIMLDPPPEDLMDRPPRDPKTTISHPAAVFRWLLYGATIFAVTLAALLLAPGELSVEQANVPMTMAFATAALSFLLGGLAMRRDPGSGLAAPIIGAVKWLSIALFITLLAVEADFMHRMLMTTALTGNQWLGAIALALVVPLVVELDKLRRR